ncbi:hypothetical protein [Micromonospora carbonacea]|uniref:hypothetical protein n=1 Tax=Micromonospora carbonacea TaxID=47853 RepID=UPI003715FB3E
MAERTLTRTRLPFVGQRGDTVTVTDGWVYLNGRRFDPLDALDLSAALAVAVQITTLNHTTPQEAHHG